MISLRIYLKKGSDIIFYIIENKNIIKRIFKCFTIKDDVIIIYGTKNIYKKLNKFLKNTNAVAISNELINNDNFKNELFKMNIDILDGRYLFKFLLLDVLDYIIKANNSKFEDMELSILANYADDILENNIIEIAEKCKLLNIVTNNPEKFNNISEKLRDNNGIMIHISKNKRKGLIKSGIIINYDFPQELFNKCKINNKAVIINLKEKIDILSKSFSGINVNYYKINEQQGNLLQYFSDEIIYESKIYGFNDFYEIRKKMKKDGIKIKNLIGVKGIINVKEFGQNVLTKLEY